MVCQYSFTEDNWFQRIFAITVCKIMEGYRNKVWKIKID